MIYIAYPSKSSEEIKEVFEELKKTFEITTPEDRHQLPRDKFVDESEKLLKGSNIFIAEASEESAGLEVETTWAHENKIPILFFVKERMDYPNALKDFHLRVIKYSTSEDLKIKLNKFLNEESPDESRQEFFQYNDKKQYKAYKKGWKRKYKWLDENPWNYFWIKEKF